MVTCFLLIDRVVIVRWLIGEPNEAKRVSEQFSRKESQ